MTPVPRLGAELDRLGQMLAELARLASDAGYAPVEPPHLFPAETLLDLYGEDLRSRAFIFPGGGGGEELCLRPDFTVPVALAHHRGGWDRAARYSYQGPVFRRQEPGSDRPAEYLQAGVESYGADDPAAAETEVLSLVLKGLETVGVTGPALTTGDLGIVFALLDALDMPERRRALLRRHIWRPARFHALIDAAVAGTQAPSARRRALIAAMSADDPLAEVERLAAAEGEILGLREVDDLLDRAAALAEAAEDLPMAPEQARLIESLLAIEAPAAEALGRMRDLSAAAGVALGPALDRFEARLDAFAAAGIDAGALPFDANFGRSLEYYDGFVFEVTAGARHLPPLAGGGRYDSLTAVFGDAARPVPAIGAMIRPEAALAAAEGRS